MQVPKNIFRGYDIRGIYPTEVNAEVAELVGKGFATLMKQNGQTQIILGHDNRKSYDVLEKAMIEGITSTGLNVIRIGHCVTPMTYFARELLGIKPSIMITASHNPKEYNGFKICGLGADSIYGDEIQDLRVFIEKGEFAVAEQKGKVIEKYIREDYVNYIVNKVKLGERKLKVAIDCGSGVGSLFAEEVFTKLGVEVVPTCCISDGDFPIHHPDPSQEANMLDFEKFVVENKCDIGLAVDGDADRVGFVLNNGEYITIDLAMIIYYRNLKLKEKRALYDVKCSRCLIDELDKLGFTHEMYRTGNSYMNMKINTENYEFAGEYSGHLWFKDKWLGFDDGIYAGLRMIEILSLSDKTISEHLENINKYYSTNEIKIAVTDENKFKIVDEVKKYSISKEYKIVTIDGVRVEMPNSWALIRCSNTGPNLTVRYEATTKEELIRIENEFNTIINNLK